MLHHHHPQHPRGATALGGMPGCGGASHRIALRTCTVLLSAQSTPVRSAMGLYGTPVILGSAVTGCINVAPYQFATALRMRSSCGRRISGHSLTVGSVLWRDFRRICVSEPTKRHREPEA